MTGHDRLLLRNICLILLTAAWTSLGCDGPLTIIVGDDEWDDDDSADGLIISTETGHALTVFQGEYSGSLANGEFVGDVDGDGLGDLVLMDGGGRTAAGDAMGNLRGAAYLFYGREAFPASVSVLDADLILRGASHIVAGLGDIDGDGFSDFAFVTDAVDAPDISEENDGFHLIYGDPVRYSGEHSTNDVGVILRASAGDGDPDHFSVSHAGDVNGDGYADTLYDVRQSLVGVDDVWSYLVLGGPDRLPQTFDLAYADATFEGTDGSFQVTLSSAGAGDLDGDGNDDLLVSLRNEDPEDVDWGRIALYHGAEEGLSGSIGPALSEARAGWHSLGNTLGGVGDLDGDGFGEVSMSDAYHIPIVYGAEERWAGATDIQAVDLVISLEVDVHFGGVAGGDFDGDGHRDLVFGEPTASYLPGSSGALHVLRGDGQRWYGEIVLGVDDAILHGIERPHSDGLNVVKDELGWGLDCGPSVNGDAYDDILVGAVTNNGGGDGGRVFLVFGGPY